MRSTVDLDPELRQALRLKSALSRRSMSDIVNDALRHALREDQEDLAGLDETYRVRQGPYRIVYAIHDELVVVEVIRVGHRGGVYRGR